MAVQHWCSVQDIRNQLGGQVYEQMTADVTGDRDEYAEDVIAAATGEVRGYILERYGAVVEGWDSVGDVPRKVRQVTRDLSICEVVARRANPTAPSDTSVWERRCREARDYLKLVADGTIDLDVEVVPGAPGGTRARVAGAHRKAAF